MTIKDKILSIFDTYHRKDFLTIDPLCCLCQFRGSKNLEIAALIAATLSYGRVERIIQTLQVIFNKTGPHIFSFTTETSYGQKKKILKGIKHRFNSGKDIALLFESIKNALTDFGSLKSLYKQGLQAHAMRQKYALDFFVNTIILYSQLHDKTDHRYFKYLLPSPVNGSACKRMNMYLRWMIRPNDGIDLGVWKDISPATLIIPLDVHTFKVCTMMKLTKRKSADWKTAEEITEKLKRIDPNDPVKFDFSLCRYGMVGEK